MRRLLIILMALAVAFASLSAGAQAATLRVRGVGVVNTTADSARIVLGVRESSADVLVAQATVNEKVNAIVAALTAAGVGSKDMGTESLYIYANYDYSDGDERLTGYTATNTISITTREMDKVGEYIDIAFANGANTLDNVQFSCMDSGDMQEEALQLAVQNAYEKAETIAEAANMTIDSVVAIDEYTDYLSSDAGAKFSNARTAEAAAGDQSTMVQASALQISAAVTMEFELSEVEP